MTLRAAKWAAVLLVALAGGLVGAPAWQIPAAETRLRVLSAHQLAHLVRVDLPEGLREKTADVRAMLPGKRVLGARLVRIGETPVAVEVSVPRLLPADTKDTETDSAAPIEIYLLAEALADPAAQDIPQRATCLMHYSARALTTRPFTPDEGIRLLAAPPTTRRGRAAGRFRTYFYWTWETPGVGQVSRPDKQASPGENKTATIHWATDLRLDAPRAVAFGADQPNVAWFLYVDGRPVADWRTSQPTDRPLRMGPVVELAAGFHLLEYVVVQTSGETIPRVFWRDRGGKEPAPIPPDLQHTVRLPGTVLVEGREGPAAGFVLARLEQRQRTHTAEQFLDLSLAAPKVAGKELPGTRWEGHQDAADVFVPAPALPALRLAFGDVVLRFPPRHAFEPPTTFALAARVLEAPPVLSAGQPFAAAGVLDALADVSPELAARLTLRWRQHDAVGGVLRSGETPCNAERVGAETPFSIPLDGNARRLEFTLALDGLEVAPTRRLRVLRPADSMAGLRAVGRSLFVGRERALLVCDPLRPLPPLAPAARRGAPHLVILDDFWAALSGPEATLRPETVLGEKLPRAVFRLAVPQGLANGAAEDLRKFDLLPALLERRPDATLLALGWDDLRGGGSALELGRHLLFLAQAAHARGARPLLLALPSLPGVAPDAVRESALLVKELGLRLEIPVVDAFSAERLGRFDGGPFSRYFAAAGGAVTLPTPNDAGRQRLCDLVMQVLSP